MEKKFKRTTVTSALPYANGPVHIGHLAGVYVPADIYVRYLRLKKPSVVTAAFSFMSLTLSPAQQTEHVMSAYTEGKMANSTEPSSGSLQGGRAVP